MTISEELREIGFVECAACGARIAADRELCLRCGAPLYETPEPVPDEDPTPASPERSHLIAVGVVAVLLLAAGVAFWNRKPHPEGVMRAAAQAAAPLAEAPSAKSSRGSSAGTPAAATSPSSAPGESATFIDSVRTASAAYVGGNFDSARAAYEQSLAQHPDDPAILNNLGQVLVRLGRLDEAAANLERAVMLAPDKWAYRFNLAHAVGQLGQWDRAASEYREARRLFPTDYATQYNLAMALHKKGDEPAAIPEFQKAIELAPDEPSFHVSLGVSLEAAGRLNDAVAEFKRYLEMAPSAPDAPQLKAHLDALVAAQARPPSPS